MFASPWVISRYINLRGSLDARIYLDPEQRKCINPKQINIREKVKSQIKFGDN